MTRFINAIHILRDWLPARRALWAAALMLGTSLTDGVGLLMLVPLLDVLAGGQALTGITAHLAGAFGAFGIPFTLGPLLAGFVFLVMVRALLMLQRDLVSLQVVRTVADDVRMRCFRTVLHAEWRWISARRQTDHVATVTAEVERIAIALQFAVQLLTGGVTLAVYALVALSLSWSMSLLAIGSALAVMALLGRQRRRALELGQMQMGAHRRMQAAVQESFSGLKLAKILGAEAGYLHAMATGVRELREQQQVFQRETGIARQALQVGGAVVVAMFLFVGIRVWSVPTSELMTLVLVFSRIIPQLSAVDQALHRVLNAVPAIESVQTLLVQADAVAEPVGSRDQRLALNDALVLDHVGVHYEGRDRSALAEVCLRIPARTTTAIMGASGAGKSTLADVIMGLLAPDEGVVRVDGVAIAGAMRHAWRASVSYVPQEVFLFHDTIRRNLQIAAPAAPDDQLRSALMRAAAGFVFDLPHGLDTVVGDGGVRLSGGERQRLALARALLGSPALLILDEATSALDLENELRVREAVENLHGDLTVVVIGHRLPTLEHADQVVVLEQGRVARVGAWCEVGATPHPTGIYPSA